MEYKRFGNTIVLRLDINDEIVSSIKEVAIKEKIKLASISGIGATNNFSIGVLNLEDKKFYPHEYVGVYEITSLLGNITTKDNEYYGHFHINAASFDNKAIGGHLIKANISATCEIFIQIIDGKVNRIANQESGINTIDFK